MKRICFLSLALILAFLPNAFAQAPQDTKPAASQEGKAKAKPTGGLMHQPVVYGKAGDGLPRNMRVRGVVTDVSFVPWACGGRVCWWGVAKIKLLNRVKGYQPKYVYVAVLCFTGEEEEYLNKVVDVRVSKLYRNEDTRNCGGIVTKINSAGVPFYRLQERMR